MINSAQHWLDSQEQYVSEHLRGFEDGMAGVPRQGNSPIYREGFTEGSETGLLDNQLLN